MKKSLLVLGLAVLVVGIGFSFIQVTHGQTPTTLRNGACGSYDTCLAGMVANFQASQGTAYTATWTCAGLNGGVSMSCSGNPAQFSTPAEGYFWSCSGTTPECLESNLNVPGTTDTPVNFGYCAGPAQSCTTPATPPSSNNPPVTPITTAPTTSSGGLCITASEPNPGSYSEDFYEQVGDACQQVFGSSENTCVVSGANTCSYGDSSDQALAYNCGMPRSSLVGYCLPGETPASDGCIAVMTPAQLQAAFGSVTCPAGSGPIGATSSGAFYIAPYSGTTVSTGNTPTTVASTVPSGSTTVTTVTTGTTSSGPVGSETSFAASQNSTFASISAGISQELGTNSQTAMSETGTTTAASGSCTSMAGTTIANSIATLQGVSQVLSSSSVPPAVLASVQNLITAVAQVLASLASCVQSGT